MKYLPTLQLKKMLLQTEVFKAQSEINKANAKFEKEYQIVQAHSALLTDPAADLVREQVVIEKIEITYENIAGIEIPSLQSLVFAKAKPSMITEPIWVGDFTSMIQALKHAYEKLKVAKEKKDLLQKELRIVSTRVNLFEKRMIPETTSIINKIKVFLSDQDLQAVACAKVSKNKILQRKKESINAD